MRFVLSVLVFLGLSAAGLVSALSEEEYRFHFGNFQVTYNKNYETSEEYINRLNVFKQNLDMINEHNAQNKSWTLGVNEFADMTWEEFRATHLGLHALSNVLPEAQAPESYDADFQVPDTVDWRTRGVVNAVKNQGGCGSCWAFSTVSSIESACALKTGHLYSLSEQQLVDCSGSYGPQGCSGGWMDNAFTYEKAAGGLCLENEYPYKGVAGACHANCKKYCPVTGYVDVAKGDESALKTAVAQQPVSVALEADQSGFQFYKSGVFDGTCGTTLDHAVVVEGYGIENGKMYWLVRNSWGANWGLQGYIKVVRHDGKGNGQCGIALAPSYPVL